MATKHFCDICREAVDLFHSRMSIQNHIYPQWTSNTDLCMNCHERCVLLIGKMKDDAKRLINDGEKVEVTMDGFGDFRIKKP